MNSDFKELLKALNEERVRYLVVGGYAVIKHTEPRYTRDLDVWVSPDIENANRVYAALQNFGAPLEGVTVEDFTDTGIVYHMGRAPVRIDILMSLEGLVFEESWANRVEAEFGDVATQYLSVQDLIVNKRIAARPQDLMDVDSLLLSEKQKKEV
jgi:Nucleotidyltransferase of unknown function (DUF6036)